MFAGITRPSALPWTRTRISPTTPPPSHSATATHLLLRRLRAHVHAAELAEDLEREEAVPGVQRLLPLPWLLRVVGDQLLSQAARVQRADGAQAARVEQPHFAAAAAVPLAALEQKAEQFRDQWPDGCAVDFDQELDGQRADVRAQSAEQIAQRAKSDVHVLAGQAGQVGGELGGQDPALRVQLFVQASTARLQLGDVAREEVQLREHGSQAFSERKRRKVNLKNDYEFYYSLKINE